MHYHTLYKPHNHVCSGYSSIITTRPTPIRYNRYIGLRCFLLIPFVYAVYVHFYMDWEDYSKRRRGGVGYLLPLIGVGSATLTNSVPIGSGNSNTSSTVPRSGAMLFYALSRSIFTAGGSDHSPLTHPYSFFPGVIFTPLLHAMKIDGRYNTLAFLSAMQAISNGVFGVLRCAPFWFFVTESVSDRACSA